MILEILLWMALPLAITLAYIGLKQTYDYYKKKHDDGKSEEI